MQASAFLRSLKAENVPPVLLLVGTETVLRRRVISRLAKLLLSEVDEEAAFERLDAGVTGLMKILDTASTGSLLTGHRIIIVRNAGALSAPSGSAGLANATSIHPIRRLPSCWKLTRQEKTGSLSRCWRKGL